MCFLVVAGYADSLLNFRGHLLDAILAQGRAVHVAAPDIPLCSALRSKLVARGLNVHEIPLRRTGMNPFTDFVTLLCLVGLIRRIKPTHVLSYTIKPVIYCTFAAWIAGVPHRYALITGLGYSFTGKAIGLRSVVRLVVQQLYRVALRRAHKVFFQNHDDEALFRKHALLRDETKSIVVNGSGVDVNSFTFKPIPIGAPHFLLIARLLGDKGVREYARAAQHIKPLRPHVKFSLVGWLDENPDSIKMAELDLWIRAGTLDFLGRLDDVRPAIAGCSVYVLPSYREGMPRTVLEAMAMGRAIITTDAPGCRETVVHGENGFLVPAQSTDALVQAMQRFIAEPTLAVSMGQRSRQIAEDKYDVYKVNVVMLREMGLQ